MSDQPSDPQHEKWVYEQRRVVAERAHDFMAEFTHRTNEATINTGSQALRALIINGAAITMLAFVDKAARQCSDSHDYQFVPTPFSTDA